MSVVKVIEVLVDSKVSWEDAAKNAISKAFETLHNVKSVYIKDHSAKVENGKIVSYRINAKVSFILDWSLDKLTLI
jgi:dodecin